MRATCVYYEELRIYIKSWYPAGDLLQQWELRSQRGCVESVGRGKELHYPRVNQDGCQLPLIEKRSHLLFSIVAQRIKQEGLVIWGLT